MAEISRPKRYGPEGRVWLVLLALALLIPDTFAKAAQPDRTVIVTAGEVPVEPGAGTPLDIRVESNRPLPSQAVVVVRGFPSSMKFSEGRLFGPGVWVVPIRALEQLKVHVLEGFSRASISLTLATLDGVSLASADMTLFAHTPPAAQGEQVAVVATLPKQLVGAEKQAALALLEKGDETLKNGNVVVARQFYQRAAGSGLPEAAMAMAATYDTHELTRMEGVVGVQPDTAMAKKWYEEAWQLGARDAEARLRRLR